MKKIIGLLLGFASVCALSACELSAVMGGLTGNSQSTESVASESVSSENGEHSHDLSRVAETKASCAQAGNKTYYKCDCGALFLDAMGLKETTIAEVTVAQEEHSLKHVAGVEATCISSGKLEYWGCTKCNLLYLDEACTQVVSKSQTTLEKTAHDLTHYEGKKSQARKTV